MKFNIGLLLACLLITFSLLPQNATADMFEKGFKLRAGGYWAYLDSSLNADIPGTGLGTKIDFESDLGLEEAKFSPFFEATYRFNKRHAVLVNYLTLHRNGTRAAISKPFEWEDKDGNLYQVSAGVKLDTVLNLDIYQTAYMFSFYSSDKWMLAGTLGLHIAQFKNSYEGTIGLVAGDGSVSASARSVSESITAPLPDIGLLTYYKLDYGVTLGARVQYFQLDIEDFKGQVLDLRAEALKYLNKKHNIALGMAYQFYGIKVDYTGTRSSLDIELNYQGPSAFIQYDF